jgi:hypothetical protein
VLDRKALESAEELMRRAEEALAAGDAATAETKAGEARAALEGAVAACRKDLERLRRARDFGGMKAEQDATREKALDLAALLKDPPPLASAEDGSVPGRQEVQAAAEDMDEASSGLGQGRAGKAAKAQDRALDKLNQGRQNAEDHVEAVRQAARDRILAYLRERTTHMLTEQRRVRKETESLDLKLKALRLASASSGAEAAIDRKDRQTAATLAENEKDLQLVAMDLADLLIEVGSTLVFPDLVSEIADDLGNLHGKLERIETGELTQRIQKDVESALEQILAALEEAQKKPAPPNPNNGRQNPSGMGPLLAKSQELKMVRALQLRVNKRTQEFHLDRPETAELSPELKIQCQTIARKQTEVERILRKVASP